jgi:hypothetical protein
MPSTTALSLADRRKIGQVRVLPGAYLCEGAAVYRVSAGAGTAQKLQSRPRAVEQESAYGAQLNFCGAEGCVRTVVLG